MADQTFLMSELQRQEVRNVWEGEVHSYLAFCLTLHLTLKLVVTQDKSRKIMMPGRLALCSKLYSVTFEASTLFCIPWDCSAPLHFLWLYSFIYLLIFFSGQLALFIAFLTLAHIYFLFFPSLLLFFIFSVPKAHSHHFFFLLPDIHQDWYSLATWKNSIHTLFNLILIISKVISILLMMSQKFRKITWLDHDLVKTPILASNGILAPNE